MTTDEPPLHVPEDDALTAAASAVVDGVATPEEEAVVAAAPDGAARVAALRGVASTLGAPPGTQDPAAAARALDAALAAFDGSGRGDGEDAGGGRRATPPAVTSLPHRRPDAEPRGLRRLALVAAALVLLVGIGALAASVVSTSDDATTFSAAPAAREPATQAESAAGGQGAVPADAATQAAPTTVPAAAAATGALSSPPSPRAAVTPTPVVNGGDLGGQDEIEALAQRAAAALDGTPDPAVASAAAALPNEIQACATPNAATAGETVGSLRYRAVGTFQGTPAVFLAYDRSGSQPPRLLLVLARSGCGLLASTHF